MYIGFGQPEHFETVAMGGPMLFVFAALDLVCSQLRLHS
eukprot:COSAG02_NODE_18970_length_907_cov_1.287129_3_plen_38_part_01